LIVDRFGNIGLGGTTTPGTLLSLGTTGANTVNISNTATSTFGYGLNIAAGCFAIGGECLSTGGGSAAGGTGAIQFANGTAFAGDATFFYNDTLDYVGIGTSTPTAKLQLASAIRPQFILTDTGGGVDTKHVYASSTAGAWTWGILNDSLTTFTERMRLTNGGNLGIGTTSPWTSLGIQASAGVNTFAIGSSTATHFLVNASGRAGVGTAAPGASLDVVGSIKASANVLADTFNNAANSANIIYRTSTR